MRRRLGLRRTTAGLTTLAAAAAMLVFLVAGASGSVTGAVNTTDDPGWNGPDPVANPGLDARGKTILGAPTQACLNGPASPPRTTPAVNCNIYSAKTDVFISGTPNPAALGAGTYFFAVLAPGGQPDPNDSGAKNLSVAFDHATNREFASDGLGAITPLNNSTHAYDAVNNVLQVAPYADTPNPGGVYILAACKIADDGNFVASVPTVKANDCKYDAFKVKAGTTVPPTTDLIVAKSATPTASFAWDAKKVADKTLVRTSNTSVVITYTASYTPTALADSITGDITVTNPNTAAATNVVVTDALNDVATTGCTVNSGSYFDGDGNKVIVLATGDTIPGLTVVDYPYTCAPPDRTATLNTATATWDKTGDFSATSGTGSGNAAVDWSNPTLVDNCVNATDVLGAASAVTLATLCVDKDGNLQTPTNVSTTYGNPAGVTASIVAAVVGPPAVPAHFDLVYKQTFTVPANGCGAFTNTADFVTNTNGLTDGTLTDNSATVTICPGVNGLTIGYWANKNGQSRISGSAFTTVGLVKVCNLDAYLLGTVNTSPFFSSLGPFQDLTGGATATCSQVASYVSGVIKAASCTSTTRTCNTMLKAQLLATALNVYFGVTNGSEQIDLVHGCAMIDSSAGTATCGGAENWSAAFGGVTNLSVFDMIHYAATQDSSSPTKNGLTNWYSQNKSIQVLAKDAFDAINNGVALSF